jgi:outer membrane receptor protein involved in Fe transport
LPSIKSATYPNNPNTTIMGAPSYDLIALSGSFAVTEDLVVRLGIENLMDQEPPLLERNSAPPPFLLAGGTFGGPNAANPALYDFIGRRYYLGATMKF